MFSFQGVIFSSKGFHFRAYRLITGRQCVILSWRNQIVKWEIWQIIDIRGNTWFLVHTAKHLSWPFSQTNTFFFWVVPSYVHVQARVYEDLIARWQNCHDSWMCDLKHVTCVRLEKIIDIFLCFAILKLFLRWGLANSKLLKKIQRSGDGSSIWIEN